MNQVLIGGDGAVLDDLGGEIDELLSGAPITARRPWPDCWPAITRTGGRGRWSSAATVRCAASRCRPGRSGGAWTEYDLMPGTEGDRDALGIRARDLVELRARSSAVLPLPGRRG